MPAEDDAAPSRPAKQWTAFLGRRRLARGAPAAVLAALKQADLETPDAPRLVFDDDTGAVVEVDLRGDLADCLSRLAPLEGSDARAEAGETRRPGRPRLGVVPREVTLLPRHWDWLSEQPGGASVALRKLVDAARNRDAPEAQALRAKTATDQFMRVMAGDLPHYEDASRALYAGRWRRFVDLVRAWPPDVADHALALAANARTDGDPEAFPPPS